MFVKTPVTSTWAASTAYWPTNIRPKFEVWMPVPHIANAPTSPRVRTRMAVIRPSASTATSAVERWCREWTIELKSSPRVAVHFTPPPSCIAAHPVSR